MMNIFRYEENPLVTPERVQPHRPDFEVVGAFNAGITEHDGEIIMLLRVAERPKSTDAAIIKAPIWNVQTRSLDILAFERQDTAFDFSDPRVIRKAGEQKFAYLTSLSYLRIARSKDGHNFCVDDQPFIYPTTEYEIFGVEDPRITIIEDTYYIVFSSVSPAGVGVGLVTTKDFKSITRHGLIFAPENKDVVIFPEKINGKYYALHRPVPNSNGSPEVWIAESENLIHWGNHRRLLGLRHDNWDNGRIGAGAVPIKTTEGWLELYHAADVHDRYCMGAVLLDLNDPSKILARSEKPIVEPQASYEIAGFFGNVVFSCGAVVQGDTVKLYYGVADTSMACAELSLSEILKSMTSA